MIPVDKNAERTAQVEALSREIFKKAQSQGLEPEWITLVGVMTVMQSIYKYKGGADASPEALGNAFIDGMSILVGLLPRDVKDYYAACQDMDKEPS